MKYVALMLVFLFLDKVLDAQTIVNGYYIALNNDSIKTKIKIPKMLFGAIDESSFQQKLIIDDSAGELRKIKPGKISAFGFTYNKEDYYYASKLVRGNKYVFLRLILPGLKTSLFYYVKTQYRRSRREICVVEKANGEDLVLTNTMGRQKMMRKLHEFYNNDTSVMKVIDEKPISKWHYKTSLERIVAAINKS